MVKKYRESKKRRTKRRKLNKRYYAISLRNLEGDDLFWIEEPYFIKSQKNLFNHLLYFINDDNFNIYFNYTYPLVINLWNFTGNRGKIYNIFSFYPNDKITLKEKIKTFIYENKCLIKTNLPKDIVRYIYDFL